MSKGPLERHERRVRRFAKIFEGEGDDDAGTEQRVDHHAASTVASLLVESGRFPNRTAALDHLLNSPHGNALLARLHKAADQTERESTMRTSETLESILKDCGPVRLCKGIVDRGRAPCTEAELVALITKHVGGNRAFAKLCETEPDVLRACSIAKAGELDVEPQVFGREAMNPNQPTNMVAAYTEILRDIREQFPSRTGAQQLAMADEELARRHHVRPQANYANVYAMPLETRSTEKHVEKRDGLRGDAYGELLAKAEEYRDTHPELSISQAFAKVYTDPANREISKRERIESASR
jgi:hypothetical protein